MHDGSGRGYGSGHTHRHHHSSTYGSHGAGSPGASRKRKRGRAAAFAIAIVAAVLALWIALQGAEGLLIEKRTGGAQSAGAEGQTEPVIPRKVRGRIRLGGSTWTWDHVIETWLLLGTDLSGNEQGTGEDYHGTMADFLMLAIFDKTDKTYAFLQLDRDTITDVTMLQADGSGYASADMQLCIAHWYGGTPEASCENTVDAVSRMLGGLPIDGYYSLGMEDIGTMNHLVGGVEVTIEDDFSESDPSLKMGETILLDDEQAFHYAHDRMNVGDGSNAGRMRRQKAYLEGFMEKVLQRTKEESAFLNDLYRELEDRAVTTMTNRDLSRLMKRVDQGRSLGTYRFEGETVVGLDLADGLYHASFYPDEESVLGVLTELYHLEEEPESEMETEDFWY